MSIEILSQFFSVINRVFDEYRKTILIASGTVMTLWLFNKLWINRRFYSNRISIRGKTVLITGGNTGIGYETAKDLLQRGARVIIACRNLNKGRRAIDKLINETESTEIDVRLMECDLCSLDSIRAFAKLYNEEEQRLDILICNAGLSWSPTIVTKDGFNSVMQANYIGHFLLTNLLLEKLRKCRPSRIINVSSKMHKATKSIDWPDAFTQFRRPRWFGAYPSSKLFQILSAFKLKKDLFVENIDVFALTPGWISTSLSNPTPQGIGWFQFILSYPLVCCLKFVFAKTPKTGASTVVFCAVEPTLEKSKDLYFQNCTATQPSLLATDPTSSERLWRMSLEAVGLDLNA